MLLGLRTFKVVTRDLARAKAWYAEVVGHAPYFDEPFYVGFEVGGAGCWRESSNSGPMGSLAATPNSE